MALIVALQQIVAEAPHAASRRHAGTFEESACPRSPNINSTEKKMDQLSTLGMAFTGVILVLAVTMAVKLASRKAYH